MYQLLSELAKFYRRYNKNILAYLFIGHILSASKHKWWAEFYTNL